MEPLRVLFLHGIEARQWPMKAELIASLQRVEIRCPNLGSADWMQTLWTGLAVIAVLAVAAVGLVVCAGVYNEISIAGAVSLVLIFVIVGYAMALLFVRYCLRRAYDDATELARRAVDFWNPHVVVGQSFGAIVALRLQCGRPLLLLSCARGYFCKWAAIDEPALEECSCCVVHGTDDGLAPIEDARKLASESKRAWLVERKGEGHGLPGLGASGLAQLLQQLCMHADVALDLDRLRPTEEPCEDECLLEPQPAG
jgi:pimeloyl-ACP methyl ester carboxylesterase